MAILVIARLTFHEAARRKVLWLALLLGLAFLTLFTLGFNAIQREILAEEPERASLLIDGARNLLILAGLYVVNFLGIMMTVLTSVDTLSGEINSGVIQTVLAKPLHRWEIVLGKWFGFVGMVTLYLLLMAGGVLLIAYLSGGYLPPHFLRGVGLIWLNCLLLLAVSLLGGSVLSTLANGVLVFGLYGLAFIGGWIEQIGSFLENQAAVEVGIVSSLIIPSEALWKRAAFEMQPALGRVFNLGPFVSSSVPSPLMIGYAALYILIALALAVRWFSRRDL